MKSAVTVCLVPEARQGPFVFHDGLDAGCREAAALGFDAVEVFPAAAAELPEESLGRLLDAHGLGLAAVGTGAGWLRHGLSFTHADAEVRGRALAFGREIVDAAGALGAPAIIGSMQGRSSPALPREEALKWLADALEALGDRAASHGQPLLYEPLNRYETDLLNRQADALAFLAGRGLGTVKLLCDLFHMNIEEADVAAALEGGAGRVGHVHWADSNRRALGFGHTDPAPLVAALRRIGYEGHLSAEVFPLPSPRAAAERTIASLRAAAATRSA
ncbi:MAG: sugar phosphate isomerase/epimerase [Planctomycetota bacterium]|jgi:sugar phosphate isomerase/epimerase|nr:MAG: sugar phosphate isomerase/epimerase [Planctomycetota bacterium]